MREADRKRRYKEHGNVPGQQAQYCGVDGQGADGNDEHQPRKIDERDQNAEHVPRGVASLSPEMSDRDLRQRILQRLAGKCDEKDFRNAKRRAPKQEKLKHYGRHAGERAESQRDEEASPDKVAGPLVVMGTAGNVYDRLLDAEGTDNADEGWSNRCDGVDTSVMGTERSSYDDPCNGAKGDGRNARYGGLAYRRNTGCCLAVPTGHLPSAPEAAKFPHFGNFHPNPAPCRYHLSACVVHTSAGARYRWLMRC